jgi:hypothetical protein
MFKIYAKEKGKKFFAPTNSPLDLVHFENGFPVLILFDRAQLVAVSIERIHGAKWRDSEFAVHPFVRSGDCDYSFKIIDVEIHFSAFHWFF